MRGLYLGNHTSFIEKTQIKGSGELALLAKSSGLEVIKTIIQPGKTFYVYPSDKNESMEFFFIIEGELVLENKDETKLANLRLTKGDYFYIHQLKDTVFFKANSKAVLLWVLSEPVFHQVSNQIKSLVEIVKMVEEKDHYTYEHCQRVQEYAIKVARKLKLEKEKVEALVFASSFHDIGKITTPTEILVKPSRLTAEEYLIIKKHPVDGYNLVKDELKNYGEHYYRTIADIIVQHHERLDGSGYPNGISGNQILVEAKIIGVVDTFDAITGNRPYRKKQPVAKAVEELILLTGIHYDEQVVNALIDVLIEEGQYKF